MSALDIIRTEELAVSGFTEEASAVSETRVAIDRLEKAYDGWQLGNPPSSKELDAAILALIRGDQ